MQNQPPPSLSVVIPVYNEAENISPTLDALRANVPVPHEILVFTTAMTTPRCRSCSA
ncbi:MAG: hypothetical protein NTY01_08895 [Verrucomicrobia bacterium]|nr:hypothetical protein [Verrucomicrobiota bacterium]